MPYFLHGGIRSAAPSEAELNLGYTRSPDYVTMPKAPPKPKAVVPAAQSVVPTPAAPSAQVEQPKPSEPVVTPQQLGYATNGAPVEPVSNQQTATTEEKKAAKQKRKMLADVINVDIPTARVRAGLADNGFNSAVHAALETFTDVKSYGDLPDATVAYITRQKPEPTNPKLADDQTRANDRKLDELYATFMNADKAARAALPVDDATTGLLKSLVSRYLLRTGDDAITAFAATANYIVRAMAEHGTRIIKAQDKKVLQLHHIANDELEGLDIWPLIANLKAVKAARVTFAIRQQELEAKAEEEKKKKVKKTKAERDAERAALAALPPAPPVEKKKREKTATDEFKHHTHLIFRTVVEEIVGRNEAGKRAADVSNEARVFGSSVVCELMARYVPLIREQSDYSGVKTIKANTINVITRSLIIDAGRSSDAIMAYVNERVSKCINHAHQPASEKPRKPAKSKKPVAEPAPDAQPVADSSVSSSATSSPAAQPPAQSVVLATESPKDTPLVTVVAPMVTIVA